MEQAITLLEVIDFDADGTSRNKNVWRYYSQVDAICDAWRLHKDFIKNHAAEFDIDELVNRDDVEFGQVLGKRHMLMVKSVDASVIRIYSIIRVYAGMTIEIG